MSDFDKELANSSLKVKRVLPGLAVKDRAGNIPYYRARIINQSDRIQWAQTNHPEHKLVYFAGDTFMWWCPRCRHTVWEQECQMRFIRNCPMCQGKVLALSPGDWLQIHFRHAVNLSWANWWGWRIDA